MGSRPHRIGTLVLSAAMVLIGLALLATAIAAGASALSGRMVLGALFCAAGGARLVLLLKTRAE